MKIPRVRISTRCLLFLVTVIAAYLAGVVSRRAELVRVWNEIESARAQFALESEQVELALTQDLRITGPGDLDRIEKLLDELDAYDATIFGSLAAEGDP